MDLGKVIKVLNRTIRMKSSEVNKSNVKELLVTIIKYKPSNLISN